HTPRPLSSLSSVEGAFLAADVEFTRTENPEHQLEAGAHLLLVGKFAVQLAIPGVAGVDLQNELSALHRRGVEGLVLRTTDEVDTVGLRLLSLLLRLAHLIFGEPSLLRDTLDPLAEVPL